MLPNPNAEEQAYLEQLNHFLKEETGYQWIQGTKPQTLAFALTDSPAGLAAWIVEKFRAWTDNDGSPEDAVSRDEMLANISLYWFTGAIGSSFWPYYARMHGPWPMPDGETIKVPMGYAEFPKEILSPPRSLAAAHLCGHPPLDPDAAGRAFRGAGAARGAGARGRRVLPGAVRAPEFAATVSDQRVERPLRPRGLAATAGRCARRIDDRLRAAIAVALASVR